VSTRDERPRTGANAWSPTGLSADGSGAALEPAAESAAESMSAAPDPWIGRVIGRFKLLERIGAGGMAVVYRAEEQGLIRRDVAIKLLTPESALSPATLARFLKEAQLIADIRHPNVVHVIDVGRTDDGQLYLVMELLVGHTLHQELRDMAARGEAFTWASAAGITLQICGALKAAHRLKVVHRDIKPSNCFCIEVDGDQDFIKLLDFGIAKAQAGATTDESLDTPLTQEGMFVGTPHYAAPEVIAVRPDWPVDGRVDVFAVGVILYQMLTGHLPFQGDSKLDVLYKTVHITPPSPRERAPERDIPEEVDALVMTALAIDPNDRFTTVEAFAAAIRAHSERPRVITSPPPEARGEPVRATPPVRRSGVTGPRDGDETPVGEAQLAASGPAGDAPPTAPNQRAEPAAPTSSSRGMLGILVVMLLGLVALLALLIHELGSAPEPTKSPAMPRTQVARPNPQERPIDVTPPPSPVREQPIVTPPVIELPEPDPEPPETADLHAARKQQIRERVRALARGEAILRCLPDEVLPDDGVADEIVVVVSVDPDGRTRATARAGGVKRRLPRSADPCILGLVAGLRFPVADATVELPITLSLD
jgi:serine/threonine protein kinase